MRKDEPAIKLRRKPKRHNHIPAKLGYGRPFCGVNESTLPLDHARVLSELRRN